MDMENTNERTADVQYSLRGAAQFIEIGRLNAQVAAQQERINSLSKQKKKMFRAIVLLVILAVASITAAGFLFFSNTGIDQESYDAGYKEGYDIGYNSGKKAIAAQTEETPPAVTEPESEHAVSEESPEDLPPTAYEEPDYIVNISSFKFHLPDCGSVSQISDENKQEYVGTREELIASGYEPCKNCSP